MGVGHAVRLPGTFATLRPEQSPLAGENRALFFDRDGVITKERPDYVKSVEEMEILPGVKEGLSKLKPSNFLLIIVTNQSAVNRGLLTLETLSSIHAALTEELAISGIRIDAIYLCPHRPEEKCPCRKPQPGLLLKAALDWRIDLHKSWLIGDKDSDLHAANAAGCRTLRVPTNEPFALTRAIEYVLQIEDMQQFSF